MKTRLLPAATGIAAAAALLTASLALAGGTTLHLTAKDNHKSFTVQNGTGIVITLASNRSTGYHWTRGKTSAVKLVSHRYVQRSGGGVGAGGKEIWHFNVVGPKGMGSIQLHYVSPSKMIAKRFAVSLTVK